MIVSQEKIKVLLVEDSGLMRIMISDALRSDPNIEVVGTANNGKDGVDKSSSLNPDVIVTDMVMPSYDGLYVVKNIMAGNPKPIFLLSSLERSNSDVFDALNAGAIDFIDKPVSNNGKKSFERSITQLIKKITATKNLNRIVPDSAIGKTNNHHHTFSDSLKYDVIVIGASTGGPSAIESILDKMPANLTVPIIIAQHMPHRFLQSFCERLNDKLPHEVHLAVDGTHLNSGIYIVPGNGNTKLTAEGERVIFKSTEKRFKEFNDPSIDSVFQSVGEIFGTKAIGALLTGMGKDGASGLKTIRDNGGVSIAQDAATCVVNGMPQAARDLKAVDYSVSLKDIPGFIVSCL